MSKYFALFALAASLAVAGPTVQARNTHCAERPLLVKTLVSEYGEQLTQVFEIDQARILEFFASPRQGTWTAVVTDMDLRQSCVMAIGEGLAPEKIRSIVAPFVLA